MCVSERGGEGRPPRSLGFSRLIAGSMIAISLPLPTRIVARFTLKAEGMNT